MAETIITEVVEPTIIQVEDTNTVVSKETDTRIIETEAVSTIVHKEASSVLITEAIQGPPGPPTGPGTDTVLLNYIGSGTGNTKTTTEIYGNIIYESFGVEDEIYVTWVIPSGLDRNIDPQFKGTYFPLENNIGTYTCSWEIHITAHNSDQSYEYTDFLTAIDLPIESIAFKDLLGIAPINHLFYLINSVTTIHFKLKRIASSNDPPFRVGVSDIRMEYATDGKVGEQGIQGIQGPPGDEEVAYSKQVDFISDDEMYIGEAPPGSATSAEAWRIKYVTIASDGDVSVLWADGDANFDNAWDNHLSLVYS